MTVLYAIQIVALTVFGVGLALFLGVFAYGFGSFVLMRAHTADRAFGAALRELARETLFAMLTQPLLPIFYLIGRRMDPLLYRSPALSVPPKADSDLPASVPIVFVHGYMQNRVDFVGLARAFAHRGMGPLFGFNYPWFSTIASNAKRLERFVEHVCAETRAVAVDLVCHSMGGLVAIEMMRNEAQPGAEGFGRVKVRRCVTIATPHAGVAWRGPIFGFGATSLRRGSKLLEAHAGFMLKVPTLSVFSSHDNIVHPKETAQLVSRGGRDFEVEGLGHLSILFSEAVAAEVASFLLEPGPSKAIVVPADSATEAPPAPGATEKSADVRGTEPDGRREEPGERIEHAAGEDFGEGDSRGGHRDAAR